MRDAEARLQRDEVARDLVRALDERIRAHDRDGALLKALGAVREGAIGVADLYTLVLGPLMVEIGDRWQTGDTRVWEEHFATNAVRAIVEALTPDVVGATATVPQAGRRAVLACPPEEQHDLGLRMLADRLRLAGWEVCYLGTDTPVAEIIEAARALEADTVVLSSSTHFNKALLRRTAEEIRAGLRGTTLLVGGPAFARDREWPAAELLDERSLKLPGAAREQGPVD